MSVPTPLTYIPDALDARSLLQGRGPCLSHGVEGSNQLRLSVDPSPYNERNNQSLSVLLEDRKRIKGVICRAYEYLKCPWGMFGCDAKY